MKEPKCPECDKLRIVCDKSQAIGEFMDWLHEQGYTIAERHEHCANCFTCSYNKQEFRAEYQGKTRERFFSGEMVPVCTPEELKAGRFAEPQCGIAEHGLFPVFLPIEQTLAKFFEIDLVKVEEERRRLLDYIRDKAAVNAMRTDIPRLSTTPA
jgi:hypothetical protein